MNIITIQILAFLFGGGIVFGAIEFLLKIGGFSSTLKHFKEDISEIKTDCKGIWGILSKHGEDISGLKAHTAYGVSGSPVIPNEKGKALLEKSGFNKNYPNLKEEIFGLMNSWSLRTLYDYEKGSERALNELKNNPLMDEMKTYAVNNPDEPLELIFRVASWVIRDDYAEYKRKEGL